MALLSTFIDFHTMTVDVKLGELLESPVNLYDHNVAGNGKRDGLKTIQERTISSRASRTEEGSETIPLGSRGQRPRSAQLTEIFSSDDIVRPPMKVGEFQRNRLERNISGKNSGGNCNTEQCNIRPWVRRGTGLRFCSGGSGRHVVICVAA